jgi:hypothetical protein
MEAYKILTSIRQMAWQRAKGELMAFLETFWPECDSRGQLADNGFDDAKNRIENFIEDMENNL